MYSSEKIFFFFFSFLSLSRCSLNICSLMLVNKKKRKWVYWTCYRRMLCGVYRSHQLITNKGQNREGNCCILWAALQLCNHPGQQKSLSKQIAAIRKDAISWHCFKCQQQTRHSLRRWWWRGVFRWTSGGNTTADQTMGLNWEGQLASFSVSFTLFCFGNKMRTMNYDFFLNWFENRWECIMMFNHSEFV